MKKLNILTITAIAMMVSVSTWANTGSHENDQAEMPMMNQGENSSMMEPQMMNKSTKGDHKKEHHMSMMGDGSHGMTMGPHMMQMMGQHQQHNMNSMGGGNGGVMKPQMMQMRQQHMGTMEQSLANIEALLTKLIEIQKP
jgi:hypothetical protein